MDDKITPKKAPIQWRWDGEKSEHITFVSPVAGCIYILNPTAALIFSLCDGQHTLPQIVETITEKYIDADKNKVEKDVELFIEHLNRLGVTCF